MYLVTGANGQLGTELSKVLPKDTIYTDELPTEAISCTAYITKVGV